MSQIWLKPRSSSTETAIQSPLGDHATEGTPRPVKSADASVSPLRLSTTAIPEPVDPAGTTSRRPSGAHDGAPSEQQLGGAALRTIRPPVSTKTTCPDAVAE
jgi:hypothetical protein